MMTRPDAWESEERLAITTADWNRRTSTRPSSSLNSSRKNKARSPFPSTHQPPLANLSNPGQLPGLLDGMSSEAMRTRIIQSTSSTFSSRQVVLTPHYSASLDTQFPSILDTRTTSSLPRQQQLDLTSPPNSTLNPPCPCLPSAAPLQSSGSASSSLPLRRLSRREERQHDRTSEDLRVGSLDSPVLRSYSPLRA